MNDFYFFYLVVLLFGLSNCVIWSAIVYHYRELCGGRYWLAGSAAGIVGGMILFVQGNSGSMWATVGGHTFVQIGFWLNYISIRRFHGYSSPSWTAFPLALGVVGVLITFNAWQGHNPTYTLAQSLPLLLTVLFLLKRNVWELGTAITCVSMAIACGSHWATATGNAIMLAGFFTHSDLKFFGALQLLIFLCAAVAWNFGFLISFIGQLRRDVDQLANQDDLTGLPNRRLFMRQLQAACGSASRKNTLSVMLIDLDRFKAINDTYGHAAGDAALNHAALVVRRHLRATDLFARLGGDEFSVLLTKTREEEAGAVAERIIDALQASPFRWQNVTMPLTASIGIASSNGGPGERPDLIMEKADLALYETKRSGRNSFTVHTPAPSQEPLNTVIAFKNPGYRVKLASPQ